MNATPSRVRPGEWYGDMAAWLRENGEDNDQQLDRLRRNLRRAREQELTPRQGQLLELYYDRGLNTVEIGQQLGLNPSTVSRTLRRARERLYRCLRYGL